MTSLHHWLGAHPHVFVTPVKETNYFAYRASELTADFSTIPKANPVFPIRMSRYWKQFDPARLHLELYDDLKLGRGGLLRRVYGFLGVNENFETDLSTRLNPSGVPASRLLAPLLRKDRVSRVARAFLSDRLHPRAARAFDRWRARQLVRSPLDPEFRADLIERYRDDIRRLEQRLGRDLSAWLED